MGITGIVARKTIYLYVLRFKREHDGRFPTTREIAHACDISSTSQVVRYLYLLEEDGLLLREGKYWIVVGGQWALLL